MNILLGILFWFLIVIAVIVLLFVFSLGVLVVCLVTSIFLPDKYLFKSKRKSNEK